jgi:hypothetical protein
MSGGNASADEPVSSAVRFNREIVRILQRKCVSCHTEPGLAMPLESYQDVRSWARAIREEILERRMPPSPAANGVRPLLNDPSLTAREIALLTTWVDGGTPRGDAADLPPAVSHAPWAAGRPDLEVQLPPQKVATDDEPYVRRVTVKGGHTADRWVRGFDVAPGDKRVLRSVFVSVSDRNGSDQFIGGWTAWHAMTATPAGTAHFLPAGAILNVELHYKGWTEQETPVADATIMGLYFADAAPAVPLRTATVTATTAAAADARPRVAGELTVREATTVWALRPRLEAGDAIAPGMIEVKAIRPDGGIEPILWVKDHTPDWQMPFVLRDPLTLARGSRVVLVGYGAAGAKALKASLSIVSYPANASASVPTGSR